jgi:ubiquinone/menaquinone biosynthesis C-methylase UbiE
MKDTTERLSPERTRTVEERVIDAMHRFAYTTVKDYAKPTDRLLEIGFGEGYGAEIVESWVGEYVGVEVEPQAVAHATEKYGRPTVSFVHYDGVRLPYDDASFDLVIAFQVLEHVPDPDAFLREARRVTRSGRCVLIVTPNRNHRVRDGERPWNRYHVREFSPGELDAVMRNVFESFQIFGIHGSPEMKEIEKNRVARARKLARLDPFGLRYVLPEGFDSRLRTLLRRRQTAGGVSSAESQIGVEHVRRASEDVDGSLDLLAVGQLS